LLKFNFITLLLLFFVTGCFCCPASKPKEIKKMPLEDLEKYGMPTSTYVEVRGMPSYADMVYTYTYIGDPNTIQSVDDIYYPILSKKQYELYTQTLEQDKEGIWVINMDKAKELGLKFRVFVRHKTSDKSFIEKPPKADWADYKGWTYYGNKIDSQALDLIKTGEIAPLLHKDIVLIKAEE